MRLIQIPAPLPLREFISHYRVIGFELPDMRSMPPKAYPPRPETCLQFFLTPGLLHYPGSTEKIVTDKAMIIGQHNTTTNRVVNEKLFSIQVVFSPAGFYRLTGVPANELLNKTIPASELLGSEIDLLHAQLLESTQEAGMITLIEKYFLSLTTRAGIQAHAIDLAAGLLLQEAGSRKLDHYVSQSYLSHRQFDRKFIERTGVSAREFIRITRFNQAYLMKNALPGKDWLTIALHSGYYDYQHLARDYRDFTGYSPAAFFRLDSPERSLGAEEVYL